MVDQYADYRETIVISDQLFRGLHHSRGEHHMQYLLKPALPALLCTGMIIHDELQDQEHTHRYPVIL